MTDKKVPGSGWVYMIYDARDRLVLTSDGNSRTNNKWYYTKYDELNRSTEKGEIVFNAVTRSTLEDYYKANIQFYSTNSVSVKPVEDMIYDFFPAVSPYNDGRYSFASNTLATMAEKATNTKGLLVAKRLSYNQKDIISSLILVEVYYYDKYGRIIQTVNRNYQGYFERTSNDYNFAGQIIQTRTIQNYSPTNVYIVDTYFKYDHRGRLTQTDYQVDGNIGNLVPRTIVSAMVYNEAGQLKTKYQHSQGSNIAFLQKIDYRYNIRGWLTGINEPHLAAADGDLFGMTLYYNRSSSGLPGYWNGNIKDEKWACGGYLDQVNTYNYDGVNRLTEGLFLNGTNGNANSFRSTYSYDWNGNISNLSRWGSTGGLVDQISFGYKVYSNQMDYSNDPYGDVPNNFDFPGTLTGYNHYQYDANGNQTRDDYRYFNVIYNSFNLPSEFDFGSNKKTTYNYDGLGKKLTMIHAPGTYYPTNTEYRGQFVHQSCNGTSSLKYIITPEGRLLNKGTNVAPVWEWNYDLTDHLGNVRAVFRPTAANGVEKLGHTNYLPFGLKMPYPYSSASASNYLYNGKEQQTGGSLDLYDYGARFYDPALGRWHGVDPLAEKRPSESPFSYCGNNPINRIDPTGMIWDDQQSADDLKKKSFEKIIYLTKGIEDRNRVIGNNKTSEDRKTDLNEQISGMMDRIGELGNSMNDIDQLGADQDHTYVLNDGGTGDLRPVGNVTETDAKNKIVSINATTNGLAFHEIRHVSQSLNAGGLKFIDGKLQNAGTTRESQGKMEVGAYQSQFSYTGYRIGGKTVYTPYAITPEFVGSLKNEKGELFYPFMNSLK